MENIPHKDEVSVVPGTSQRRRAARSLVTEIPEDFPSDLVGSSCMSMADSMEVLKEIFSKDNDNAQPVLIDGSTNNPIPMDVLSYNHLFLFFSSLTNISDADIEALKIVHEEIKADDKCNIVWIPIVEQWTDERRNEFEILRRKMPWYIVQCSSTLTAGNKFIKEEWNFKGKPIVVEMNKQGSKINSDALPIFREQRIKDWPFLKRQEEKLKRRWREIMVVVGRRAD